MKEIKNSWPEVLLTGSDENAKRIYKKDWSKHLMGPIENWSQSFITILTTAMGSRFPALMLWGSDFIAFFNDGYGTVLGDKQIWALGKPLQEIWPEAWESLYGMLKGVIETGNGSWAEDQIYFLHRKGYPEESYFTFSFARIIDERGGFGGILCTAIETTEKVIGDRRLKSLREIGNRAGTKSTVKEVYAESLAVIKEQSRDIPFAVLLIVSPDGNTVEVFDSICMETPSGSFNLSDIPVLQRVFDNGTAEFIDQIPEGFKHTPIETDQDPVKLTCVLPIKISKTTVSGFLFVGLSPHLPFEDPYRSFLDLLEGQISAVAASAKTQEEARERAKALAELDQMKTAFFSNVSHEFRTPLTLLLAPLEDAMGQNRDQDIHIDRETFESIYRNALRLLKLVNSLLDFSKMEAGRSEASFEPVDLAEYTEGLASQFRAVMEKGNLNLEVEIDTLSEPIFVDRDMWEKIVLNLLSNAMKFTFEGGVKVLLKEFPNEVELIVEDSGIGISKKELPKIFNRFHRVEGAKSRTFEGSGIGLAIVQDMVKIHSGKIKVESTEGKGTSFRITIPKGHAHLPPDKIKTKAVTITTHSKTHGFIEEASRWIPDITNDTDHSRTNSTILVVDDNADMREYLTRVLDKNYNVLAASNGREALQIVKTGQADLIISDIMMPVMNGFELLKKLREQKKDSRLPVIFLSARAGKEATIEGLEAEADDYLIKPFSSKELIARVRTQLALVALQSDLESERQALLIKDEHLKQANSNLQKSNTNLSQFAFVASHDLQEPVRKISTFVQMLDQNLGDMEKSKTYLEKIKYSASRMAVLISDLLSFSELSKTEKVFEKVDLNKIVENIKNDFDLIIEEKHASVQCSALPVINAIPGQMTQLFSNLLSNSLKYVEKDLKPVITISSSLLPIEEIEKNSALSPNKVYYKIEFKDNGIGIDEKYVERIFVMFQRLHSKSEYSGTGIGLAICKKITQNHHGDIYIIPGTQGAVFNVILPTT
ncbi:MAG: response regulator [Bacteroidetes bacterium]|nr:response regulator [Bacteroidota bacterium]